MGDEDAHAGRHRTGRLPTAEEPAGQAEQADLLLGRLVAVPGAGRMAQIGVGARAVGGMVLVAALVLAVLGGRWWWVEQRATAVPMATGAAEVASATVAPTAGAASLGATGEVPQPGDGQPGEGQPGEAKAAQVGETGAPATEGPLLVHVIGEVAAPGVVEVEAGSRVVDAVDAAGGLTSEADPGSVNLARAVVDGEQVWIGAPGEEPPPGWVAGVPVTGTGALGSSGTGGAPGSGTGQEQSSTPVVDLNAATQAELEELPGIGPVTAGRILEWREEHGRFTAVAELLEVSGIGDRTLEDLEPHVTVG
ncbi:helix-hairpin-helix domain-containing protein [Serinicoccus hydrothermalis]|nr:helix-hairpin-helix domain-containing protein [Serinicoccus hydrothermalis]